MKTNNIYRIIFMIIIIIMITIVLLISNKSTFENNSEYAIENYIVKNGDSLWSIGKNNIGDHADIREWVYSVKDLNNISNEIYPGENINIYVYIG